MAGYRDVIPRYLGRRSESSRGVTSFSIVERTPSRIDDRIVFAAVLSHAPSPLLSLRTGKLQWENKINDVISITYTQPISEG